MGSGGSERTRPISRSVHEIMAHRFPFEDFEPKEEMKKKVQKNEEKKRKIDDEEEE